MKKIIALVIVLALGIAGYILYDLYSDNANITPIVKEPDEKIEDIIKDTPKEAQNNTDFPLKLPAGFSISVLASDMGAPREMVIDGQGNMWVSRTKEGLITQLVLKDGKVESQNDIFRNLNRPHGLAIDNEDPYLMYIAEENKISRVRLYSEAPLEKIADLPLGGRHYTRDIEIGADNRLYISLGSTCDTCYETNDEIATVISMNKDGGDRTIFATGLRNAVFLKTHPQTGELWATEMGRDLLGDDLPPDEINIVRAGQDYGWPICYGKNIHDTVFDKNTYIKNPCEAPQTQPSYIDLQAHSAPIGLDFVTSDWPQEYQDDLIVAYHGSWNRTVPTGYKLVRMQLDKQGNYQGTFDFITGWLTEDETSFGRPAGVLFNQGKLYVSDDKAGLIYVISFDN